MTDQLRDEKGRFVEQYPNDGEGDFKKDNEESFDSEEASRVANEHSWQYHRKKVLEEYDLSEDWVDE